MTWISRALVAPAERSAHWLSDRMVKRENRRGAADVDRHWFRRDERPEVL